MARSRAHRAGRHNLCLVGRCPDAPEPAETAAEASHDLEEAVEEFLGGEATLAELRGAILVAVAKATDENPSPGMVRALGDALQMYRFATTVT